MTLKNKFPFRLGAPSYVLPADIVTNAAYLSDKVDDIELLVFESDEKAALPDSDAIAELKRIACKNDLTYTVHLPLDIRFGAADSIERRRSIGKCCRVVERVQPLFPFGYVLHCSHNENKKPSRDDIARWQEHVGRSIEELLSSTGLPSESLCIETLDYPFEFIDPVLVRLELSICLDLGHILFNGFPFEDYLDGYLGRSRIIHLHGIENGKDHRELSEKDGKYLSLLYQRLKGDKIRRVISLEVFDHDALEASMSVMEKLYS